MDKQVNKINNEVVVRIRVRDAFVPSDGCIFLAAGIYYIINFINFIIFSFLITIL